VKIKLPFLCRPSSGLVTIATELSRLQSCGRYIKNRVTYCLCVPYLTHRILLVLHCMSPTKASSHSFVQVWDQKWGSQTHSYQLRVYPSVPLTLLYTEGMLGCWVFPTAGLDATEKRKISRPCQESNPGRIAHSLLARLTELSRRYEARSTQ
jgi:hypothetical protein